MIKIRKKENQYISYEVVKNKLYLNLKIYYRNYILFPSFINLSDIN